MADFSWETGQFSSSPGGDSLESLNKWLLESLDRISRLNHTIQSSIHTRLTAQEIFREAIPALKQLVHFCAMGFFLFDESKLECKLTTCQPPDAAQALQKELDAQIESGHFAWILNHERAVVFPGDGECSHVLMHVIGTRSGPQGMFIGITRKAFLPDAAQKMISNVLLMCATSLENAELMEKLRRGKEHLEEVVRQRTQDLIIAMQEAQSANEAKTRFLGNMSHELRTPLNGVIGMAQLLKDTELQPEQHEFVASIEDCSRSLLVLVGDLLDISRIETGDISLNVDDFNLRDLLEVQTEVLACSAQEKGLEFILEFDPEIDSQVRGDSTRLRQVVFNLAGNAIKFTQQGEIILKVRLLDKDEASQKIEFSVTDTGIGIPKDSQEKIFDRFFQVDDSYRRTQGGTGLGTSISRDLVWLMDGKIGLESEEGRGSRFWFTITLPRGAQATGVESSQPSPELKDRTVLICTRNRALGSTLAWMTEFLGCKPHLLNSSAMPNDVLGPLREQVSSLLIFDLDLFDHSVGGEMLAPVLDFDGKDQGVVLLGKQGTTARLKKQLPNGAWVGLSKPVLLDKLREAMIHSLSNMRQMQNGVALTVESDRLPLENRRVLLAEDNRVNQVIAVKLLEKMGAETIVVPDGRQAVEKFGGEKFDLVLMDLHMPELDGIGATREIRELENQRGYHLKKIPIVALTADVRDAHLRSCMEAGMNDFLTKPLDMERLESLIVKLIGEPASDQT